MGNEKAVHHRSEPGQAQLYLLPSQGLFTYYVSQNGGICRSPKGGSMCCFEKVKEVRKVKEVKIMKKVKRSDGS